MLQRWVTRRCLRQDAPGLSTARDGIGKFLAQQIATHSSTEPLSGASRPDTFTYHFNQGRGACWKDIPRQLLWLGAFSDTHSGGYTHAMSLNASGGLYPDLDPNWQPGQGTLAPWGTFDDEDGYEWARLIYGALETFEINRAALDQGQEIHHPGQPTMLSLSKDENDIWSLTMRRQTGYVPPASKRGRWLNHEELHDLAFHIATEPDRKHVILDNPPSHRDPFMFAVAHFLEGPTSPSDWLEYVAEQATSRTGSLPLVT